MVNWEAFLIPYRQAVNELTVKFRGCAEAFAAQGRHSPIELVEGRVKRVGSILEKANRKNIPLGEIAEKIEDIAGIRITCKFVEDIAAVAELVRARDGHDMTVVAERDYIKNTKPSGYRSYHMHIRYKTVVADKPEEVLAEIQIRTMAMNFWATVEHSMKYKYNGNIPEEVQQRLISSAEASFRLDREMSAIREEILEARRVIELKNDMVNEILKNLQNLYFVAKLDITEELNRRFLQMYEERNLEKLVEFNEKLKVMVEIYSAER